MASTLTVANTINWSIANGLGRPLTAFTASEPAITSANLILQTILAPPFNWNWNRTSVSFNTSANVQDYATSASTFGVIEKASYIPGALVTSVTVNSNVATITASNGFLVGDLVTITGLATSVLNVTNTTITAATSTTFSFSITTGDVSPTSDTGLAVSGKASEITNVINVLGAGNETGSPNSIAPQIDDNAGNITFRILPVPDQVYKVTVIFQKKIPALIAATSTTWAPIPDQYAYIYEWGFLALMSSYLQDPRWTSYNQKFVASLLGAAEGLSEDQRNVFQTAWLNTMTEQQVVGFKAQQGVQSRGV